MEKANRQIDADSPMMPLTILSIFAGATLGLRLRVLILLPVIMGGWLMTILIGISIGTTTLSVIVSMALIATGLQLGYLVGSLLRFILAAGRVRRGSIHQQAWVPAPDVTSASPAE
jgi:hypothetical protein